MTEATQKAAGRRKEVVGEVVSNKMKKTIVWRTRVRSRFVWRIGRIRSIEAPVVPMNEARIDPAARKAVLVRGVAIRSPRSRIPPEITKRPARITTQDSATACHRHRRKL